MRAIGIKKWVMVCLAVGCIIQTGCSKSNNPAEPSEARLYIQGEPPSLDPRFAYDSSTQLVLREMYEGLTRVGKNGEPELALAESVRVSRDGTVYTFRLRPTLWSNGLEVTADDFVFAWKSALDPAQSHPISETLFVLYNGRRAHLRSCHLADVGVRSIDKRTLEVTLEHPLSYFLELLASPVFSPLCRALVEKDPNFSTTASSVSNGPFVLKERKEKSHLILEKNPRYWNAQEVAVDKLSFQIIEDPEKAYNMFLAGCLDWHGEPCGSLCRKAEADLPRAGIFATYHFGSSYQLLCRVDAPHLRSVKIRKAIACALNRQNMCDTILKGGELPAFSISPPGLSYLDALPFEDNRPDSARALFEEGLAELGFSSSFPAIVFSYRSDPVIDAMMESIQSQLIEVLPLKVALEPLDRASYLKRIYTGTYEVMCMALNVWVHDPASNLGAFKFQRTPLNSTGWSNPEYVRLLDKAEATLNAAERRECFKKAESLIMGQLPVIPICSQSLKYLKSPRLTGEVLSPVGIVELKWLKTTPSQSVPKK